MKFDIITIFPDIFDSYFNESILKRAQDKKLIKIKVNNLRDYAEDKRKTVDDTPYGGGAGMVMRVEPIFKCLKKVSARGGSAFGGKTRIILFSAKGKKYTQADAKRLAKYDSLVLICGRYEGVDERVAQYLADEEISIGDYVLTGGEIPAMILIDSIARLLPGVLGNEDSNKYESHSSKNYLEYPQYTKPENFFPKGESALGGQGWKVPKILLSGNHKKIEEWRKKKSQNK